MITKQALSKHRQALHRLLEEIRTHAYYSAHADPLIQGSPGEVFRSCGNKNCRCANNPEQRHGPYPVIKIYRDGKQRQVALKNSQREELQLAKNYQQQTKHFLQLKSSCLELEKLVKDFIRKRIKEWP